MPRQIKNNADYFPHDNDMRNDDKIKAVRRVYGHVGYSIWNMMLEKLCKANDFTLPFNPISVELWAGDLDIDSEKLEQIIYYFIKLELLTVLDGIIFSEKMIERFGGLIQKRDRERNYKKSFSTPKTSEIGIINAENEFKDGFSTLKTPQKDIINAESTQSKVKESKVNKSKVKESKVFTPPSLLEVENYFLENGFSKEAAKRAFDHYNVADWHDTNGNKVKNWKQKMHTVWFKEENRIQTNSGAVAGKKSNIQIIAEQHEQLISNHAAKYGNTKGGDIKW